MKAISLSAAFTTNRVEETRDFYVRYFGAKVTFDCGWYVNLEFGSSLATLQFMSPRQPEHLAGSGAGLMYNFAVDDVDEEYRRLTAEGLPVVVPIEEHPWGIEDLQFRIRTVLLSTSFQRGSRTMNSGSTITKR